MSRELNARVAREVMGEPKPTDPVRVVGKISTVTVFEHYPWRAWEPEAIDDGWTWRPRPFLTSIADAWLVVEKMREHPNPKHRTLRLVSYPYSRTYATFDLDADEGDWSEANGEHADCEAICLAALFVESLVRNKEMADAMDFEDMVRGILAGHENTVKGATAADTHAARRRTFDRLRKAFGAGEIAP